MQFSHDVDIDALRKMKSQLGEDAKLEDNVLVEKGQWILAKK